MDITVEVEQFRKISTIKFHIVEAGGSQPLAEGVAKVVSSPLRPSHVFEGASHV